MCVRFPRILLREDINLAAGILVAMGEGWGHNAHSLENRISFNLPLLFFFFILCVHFSPPVCLLSLSPPSGRDMIIFILCKWK